MRQLILGFAIVFVFTSCSKKQIEKPELYNAKDYFPLINNSYWIYAKIEIHIDSDVSLFDTVYSELKMKLLEYDEILEHYRLERFTRPDSLSPWEDFDVITINWDELTLQWVENNHRYVKLTDPVYLNKSWDGNIYSILEDWNYYYSKLNRTFEIAPYSFSETITVEKRNEINAIQNERAFEVFQKDVGPVYDYLADFSIQAGQINKGFSIELLLKKYGIE
jgi:hypothetical protein